jgi:hypothetical protein
MLDLYAHLQLCRQAQGDQLLRSSIANRFHEAEPRLHRVMSPSFSGIDAWRLLQTPLDRPSFLM